MRGGARAEAWGGVRGKVDCLGTPLVDEEEEEQVERGGEGRRREHRTRRMDRVEVMPRLRQRLEPRLVRALEDATRVTRRARGEGRT